jgi:hypothetical protein
VVLYYQAEDLDQPFVGKCVGFCIELLEVYYAYVARIPTVVLCPHLSVHMDLLPLQIVQDQFAEYIAREDSVVVSVPFETLFLRHDMT